MLKIIVLAAAAIGSAAGAQQQGAAQPHPVTRATVAGQLDSAFAAADTNHDGSLTTNELAAYEAKELQRVVDAVRGRLQAQFKALDTNKDGQLSWAEFSAQLSGVKANETPADVLRKLDTNHDGKVSAAEFRAPRLAQFDKVDLNHDGTVTPEEELRANGRK